MKKLSLLIAVVVLSVLAVFVWPTEWRIEKVRNGEVERLIRLNRLDGRIEILSNDGWRPIDQKEQTGMERALAILEQ